ncbi:MAG TPA: hypothetical protein VMU31_04905 [Rhizomicrobium sp.]|nr:hypothetical protein [Rhizomicrobium sp.]
MRTRQDRISPRAATQPFAAVQRFALLRVSLLAVASFLLVRLALALLHG